MCVEEVASIGYQLKVGVEILVLLLTFDYCSLNIDKLVVLATSNGLTKLLCLR